MEKFRMYLLMNNQEQAFQEIENLSKEYPYDLRYQTILGDVYLNNNHPEEAYETYQRILKEEPGYAPALISMASYYQKTGQDSLYQTQLDTILLNDNVESNMKMEIMRQLIFQSEQTTKDSTQIISTHLPSQHTRYRIHSDRMSISHTPLLRPHQLVQTRIHRDFPGIQRCLRQHPLQLAGIHASNRNLRFTLRRMPTSAASHVT